MQRITADSEVKEVLSYLGVSDTDDLRASTRRRTNLEKFAQIRSKNPNVSLKLENVPTAFVEADEASGDEFKNITVTSRKFEQGDTDLPEKYHDYLIQKGMTIHEVGHILYSDYPEFKKHLEKEKKSGGGEAYTQMFQNFFNIIEDGAIEWYLSKNMRVEEELVCLRSSIHENNKVGKEHTVEGGNDFVYHYPFFHAVQVAALNIAVYDNGELLNLLDENNEQYKFAPRGNEMDRERFEDKVLPLLQKEIPPILTTSDGAERVRQVYELWEKIKQHIQQSTSPGSLDMQDGNDSYAPGVPENIGEEHGESQREANVESPPGDSEENAAGNEGGGEEKSPSQTPGEEKASKVKGDGDSDIEEKGEKGVVSEAKEDVGDVSEEVEEIISALGAGDGKNEIFIADPGDVNQETKQKAENHGEHMRRIFKRRLKQLEKDKVKRNQMGGNLDSRSMIGAEMGKSRVYKRVKKGDEKDYQCIIVVDRSGSMKGKVEDVEIAVGSLAYGLEAVGVDTCVLDTHKDKTALSKPFGAEVDRFDGELFSGRVGGGTPLRHTIQFANQRIGGGRGKVPFMIVITDGKPKKRNKVIENIKSANYKVLGLYLTDSETGVEDQISIYDGAVVVNSDDSITSSLVHLIKGVVL